MYPQSANVETQHRKHGLTPIFQDWLYDEGEDATKAVYIAKMEEIRFVAGPITARYMDKIEEERQAKLKEEEERAAKLKAEEEARKAEEEAKKAAEQEGKKTDGEDAEMTDAPQQQPEVEEPEEPKEPKK
jgi:heat shock 70kDa protein 4